MFTMKVEKYSFRVLISDNNDSGIMVGCHHDYDDNFLPKIQTYYDGTEQLTFRQVRYKGDNLAYWVNYERACWIVGKDNIDKAITMLKDYIYNQVPTILKIAESFPCWNEMCKIAESEINHYKSDFYYNDKMYISEIMQCQRNDTFLWLVRNTGTHILDYMHIDDNWNKAIIEHERKNQESKIYFHRAGILYQLESIEHLDIPIIQWRLTTISK